MQKWEYKIITNRDEQLFNQLGTEGWELVTAMMDSGNAWTGFFFKRPLSEAFHGSS